MAARFLNSIGAKLKISRQNYQRQTDITKGGIFPDTICGVYSSLLAAVQSAAVAVRGGALSLVNKD